MTVMALEGPIGVVGMGLVGGSLARAIARSLPGVRVVVVEPDPVARAGALQDRLTSEALDAPGPALASCNLVFLCTPFAELPSLLPSLAPHLAPDAIVADVSPVKGPVAALVAEHLPGARFVGCDPLVAGRDPGGYARSRPDLFVNQPVALCPRPGEEGLAGAVGALWAALGARPVVLPAEEHDRVVAATAQAPYLAATALARVVAAVPGTERLAGKGLAEVLRLATTSSDAMAGAIPANPFTPAVARVLADELRRLADLAEQDADAFLAADAEGRAHALRLLGE